MFRLRTHSRWQWLNALGLAVAAAGMLTQMVAGSNLYPTISGPAVLLATAMLVVARSGRWTRWIGLGVPLVLGAGAVVAATLTGELVDQLTNGGNLTILLGSVLHVAGLTAAIAGGIGAVLDAAWGVGVER